MMEYTERVLYSKGLPCKRKDYQIFIPLGGRAFFQLLPLGAVLSHLVEEKC